MTAAPAVRVLAGTTPLTDQAVKLDRAWSVFLWLAVAVGTLVVGLIAWVIVRNPRRRHRQLPPQNHYNIRLEIIYTVIPLVVVVGLFAVTVSLIRAVDEPKRPPDLVVEVTAFQWQWQFDYPARGAQSGSVGEKFPVLVLPASSTVRFDLTSRDVIHSFWIPGFRFKRDVFPGEVTSFQVDIGATTGSYVDSGVCAEFCGLDHLKMRFDVMVVSRAEFESWIAAHQLITSTTDQGGSP